MPLVGFANYLIPLMIVRGYAFSASESFSFWMTALVVCFLFSLVGANGLYGWATFRCRVVAYAPLTSQTFSLGHSTDSGFWHSWSQVLAASAGINIVATVLCMRCPGMTVGQCRCSPGSLRMAGWYTGRQSLTRRRSCCWWTAI